MTGRRADAALLVGTGLMLAVDVAVMRRYGLDDAVKYGADIASVVTWAIGGLVATRMRPGGRIGRLMMWLALVLAVNNIDDDRFATTVWPVTVLVTVATIATPVQWAVATHAGLAFPSGVLRDRPSVLLVRTAYAWSAFGPALILLGHPSDQCRSCQPRFGLHLLPPAVNGAGWRIEVVVWSLLLVAGVTVYLRQLVAASPRERRVRAYPAVSLLVGAGLGVVLLNRYPAGSTGPGKLAVTMGIEFAAAAAVPVGFLVGLLRERLDQARVSDLVAQLAVSPPTGLGPALARVLGDPQARLVFAAAGDDLIDDEGRTVAPPAHTRLTPIGDPATAFLLHDRSLTTQPELLAAVGGAIRLALDNARLRAEILAQLAEVRASRQRIVEAGDDARRRLERDLHDGAQQHLLSLGLSLRLIRQRLGPLDPQAVELFDETEARTRDAIRELRDLARGIHPAILTEQGLAAALEQLAHRSPVPVSLDVTPVSDLPAGIEVTAYYVASEALANVAKHARASRVSVRLDATAGGIAVRVVDDGVGGARATPGSGLAGLADRVAAIGGVLAVDSEPGRGTRVEASLPVDAGRGTRVEASLPMDAGRGTRVEASLPVDAGRGTRVEALLPVDTGRGVSDAGVHGGGVSDGGAGTPAPR